METVVLDVTGMKCGGCESAVKQTLEVLNGVEKVVPNHKLGKVELGYSTTKIDVDQITQAIEGLGYKVKPN